MHNAMKSGMWKGQPAGVLLRLMGRTEFSKIMNWGEVEILAALLLNFFLQGRG